MMEKARNRMYMDSSDLLPYRCPSCGSGKRFHSLVALQMHMSVLHPVFQSTTQQRHSNKLFEESQDEDPSGKDMEGMWDSQLTSSADVDAIFNKYSTKMDNILSRYDNESKNLETKVKIAKQLDEICRQKEELNLIKSRWKITHGISQLVEDTDEILRRRIPDGNEPTDLRRSQNSKHREQPQAAATNSPSLPVPTNLELHRQFQISVDLAAQYKHLAAEAEKKLQDKVVEEQHMKEFLHDAAYKESIAKQKLSSLMEELLERAETAEEELEKYRSQQSGLANMNFTNSRKSRSASRRKSLGDEQIPSGKQRRHRSKTVDALHSALRHDAETSAKIPEFYDKRRDGSYDRDPTTRSPDTSLQKNDERRRQGSSNARGLRSGQSPRDRGGRNVTFEGSKLSPFSNKSESRENTSFRSNREDRDAVMFCVFAHLSTVDLLRCAMVCREWRGISRHPQLWSRIRLENVEIGPQLLQSISRWSSETCLLSLRNVSKMETRNTTIDLGCFERGLEAILKSSGPSLLVISIDNCDPFITSRSMWLLSCYNKKIQSVTYRSAMDPLNHQLTWMLGATCRDIVSLEVAPMQPCSSRGLFTNNVVRLLTWCWPQLQALSFGGSDTDGRALLAVALNCQHLKVLELNHAQGVTEEAAVSVCKHGFHELKTLLFTHTPILSAAVRHFLDHCSLQLLSVTIAQTDYFPKKMKSRKILPEYTKIEASLFKLQGNPKYFRILEVQSV